MAKKDKKDKKLKKDKAVAKSTEIQLGTTEVEDSRDPSELIAGKAGKGKKSSSKKPKHEGSDSDEITAETPADATEEAPAAELEEVSANVAPVKESTEVYEFTASKGGSGKVNLAHLAAEEAPKPRAKRVAKKIEIPASSLEFIAEFPVEDILPRERNTRFRGKETESVLSQMIQRFGWTQPLTLDAEHRIVDGQYRYELAKKWKLETVPVVIAGGVSAAEGTTDLFHMLAGRIAEWDKWNYPATDAVLKSLDGGLGTETILDFETTSEAGPLRDLAREIGWFIEIIPKALSGSTVTLETLAGLLKKSLAGKYHYDPAQLLYIEALREQLEKVRQEMVDSGETAGGVRPKLEQHIGEEARKLAAGEVIAEENGYELKLSEDGKTAVFTADKEIAYVLNQVAVAEEAARVQIRSARDMESRFKEMADGKKMGLTQFKILASVFGDMTIEEAGDFFNGKAATEFNAFVDSILEENRTISANRSKNFPMTEAELKAEQYRLRGEDIRKDTEKSKKDEPKGLSSLLVDELKALLKTEGLPLSGKKAELVDRLTAAGYGADGTKGGSAISEAEEAEDHAVEAIEAIEEEAQDDGPMIFQVEDEVAVLLSEGGDSEVKVEAEDSAPDLKALKKRGRALRAKAEESELSKSERKELKAIKKQLKAARD